MAIQIRVRKTDTDFEGLGEYETRPVPAGRGWDDTNAELDMFVVFARGCVLCTRERNYYDDSDFYAVYWNREKGILDSYEYGTTRCWTYDNGAGVDATPEVIAEAEAWLERWAFERWRVYNADQAARVEAGKVVRVVKGRKIPKGTVGTVKRLWSWKTGYSEWTRKHRVLLTLEDGQEVWTDLQNVEVAEPEKYLLPEEQGRRRARAIAAEHEWHLPFSGFGLVM